MSPSIWNLRLKWPSPFEKRWLWQISAYNVSTVRDSRKSSIMANRKLTTGFKRAMDGMRTLRLSPPKCGSKSGIGCRSSVCLSVRLFISLSVSIVCHTRALWQNQRIHCRYFDTTRKGNHSSFLLQQLLVGDAPSVWNLCWKQRKTPTSADFRFWRTS